MKAVEIAPRGCQYCHETYYESDTGYRESSCKLTNLECMDKCPLICTYLVEEETTC